MRHVLAGNYILKIRIIYSFSGLILYRCMDEG